MSIQPNTTHWNYVQRRPSGIYLTLPLTQDFIKNPAAVRTAVDRSRSRWHWFAEGQRRDPALGTLSYLPVEIRRLIWRDIAGRAFWPNLLFQECWWDTSHYYSTDIFPDAALCKGFIQGQYFGNIEWTIKETLPDAF
ncbi:MAG: hypothetical protein Q9226_009109, partial [Calogaya cf. arnoldii]